MYERRSNHPAWSGGPSTSLGARPASRRRGRRRPIAYITPAKITGNSSCATTPWVHPRRNEIGLVSVTNDRTSMSGRFAAIISVGLPNRVLRFRPASPKAAPTSVWQKLSIDGVCLAKHLRFEDQDADVMLPRTWREPGLEAGVLEERFDIPAMFGRHLRQQQATPMSPLDDETVPPDFNVLNRVHFAFRAQRGNLN